MKKRDLIILIRGTAQKEELLFVKLRGNGAHEIWTLGNLQIVIPKNREIKRYTARAIMKQCEETRGELVETMTKTVYEVEVSQSEGAWLLSFPNEHRENLSTFAIHASEIDLMARDYLSAIYDLLPFSFNLEYKFKELEPTRFTYSKVYSESISRVMGLIKYGKRIN